MVICDRKISLKFIRNFYCTNVRLALLYGTECWTVERQQGSELSIPEIIIIDNYRFNLKHIDMAIPGLSYQ